VKHDDRTADLKPATFYFYNHLTLSYCFYNQVATIVKVLRTKSTEEIVDIQTLMLMDQSDEGNPQIEAKDYVLYMLKATGKVDYAIFQRLQQQFTALGANGDGTVKVDDLPHGLGLKKTHVSAFVRMLTVSTR